jgi:hypothetical protein
MEGLAVAAGGDGGKHFPPFSPNYLPVIFAKIKSSPNVRQDVTPGMEDRHAEWASASMATKITPRTSCWCT